MTRMLNRLADRTIKSKTAPGYYADGGNLYFRVAPSGARGWTFRFVSPVLAYTDGKRKGQQQTRDMGLGSYPTVTLAAARLAAEKCRQLLADDKDPIEEREKDRKQAAIEAAKTKTFDQCAADYIRTHEPGWRNLKHIQQWTNTLRTYVSPIFGRLPVQAVDTTLVLKVIEPLWAAKKVDTANRVRGRIEMILDWARARTYRDGENPARWRGHLDKLLPAREKVRKLRHHPALPYAELPAFMTRLREQPGTAARALAFTILTAARTGETIGATRAEFSQSDRLWTVPGARMKAGKEHRVPLSTAALAIVADATAAEAPADTFVFAGRKAAAPLTNMAMLKLLERMGRSDLTVHGFRSAFRDWAAERTNFPSEVVEMALAHAVSDKVEAAYRRGDLFDKRHRLMTAWATYCERGQTAADVVPMRA